VVRQRSLGSRRQVRACQKKKNLQYRQRNIHQLKYTDIWQECKCSR
jgi:hypothetical protein